MASGVLKAKSIIKLWDNPTPDQQFPAQVITLSANSCDAFLITYNFASNRASTIGEVMFAVGGQSMISVAATTNMSVGTFSGLLVRQTTASTQTSITFGDGHVAEVGAQNQTNNNFIIPVSIFGVFYS